MELSQSHCIVGLMPGQPPQVAKWVSSPVRLQAAFWNGVWWGVTMELDPRSPCGGNGWYRPVHHWASWDLPCALMNSHEGQKGVGPVLLLDAAS